MADIKASNLVMLTLLGDLRRNVNHILKVSLRWLAKVSWVVVMLEAWGPFWGFRTTQGYQCKIESAKLTASMFVWPTPSCVRDQCRAVLYLGEEEEGEGEGEEEEEEDQEEDEEEEEGGGEEEAEEDEEELGCSNKVPSERAKASSSPTPQGSTSGMPSGA